VLRVAALEGIAKRGDLTLLPDIEPRLSDSKPEVRFAAAAAVIRLGDLAKAEDPKIAQTAMSAKAGEPQATSAVMQSAK
jgi:HEAT repeat protein